MGQTGKGRSAKPNIPFFECQSSKIEGMQKSRKVELLRAFSDLGAKIGGNFAVEVQRNCTSQLHFNGRGSIQSFPRKNFWILPIKGGLPYQNLPTHSSHCHFEQKNWRVTQTRSCHRNGQNTFYPGWISNSSPSRFDRLYFPHPKHRRAAGGSSAAQAAVVPTPLVPAKCFAGGSQT